MKELWSNVKGFFGRDWTFSEKVLVVLCCILIGVVKGFLLAPVKKGIQCGNNNGNIFRQGEEEYWLDDED